MNILVEQLPTAVEIDGEACEIETDFRACLRIIMAFEDPDLASFEKQWVMLENLYKVQPGNVQAAIAQGIKFLNCGRVREEDDDDPGPRLYSFTKDADLIFSAFRQTHGLDLETVELHWWKFMALFMDLGSETAFCSLVNLRKRIKTGKATKEEQAAAHEMGDLVEIPEILTPDERESEDEFMRLVAQGQQAREG